MFEKIFHVKNVLIFFLQMEYSNVRDIYTIFIKVCTFNFSYEKCSTLKNSQSTVYHNGRVLNIIILKVYIYSI